MKHAHIIPLVGGQVVGTSQALKSKPEYIASWSAFAKNDYWCRNYYKDVPFHLVDDPGFKFNRLPKVDLITCTPPCSGLSSATTGTAGCQAPQNEHMINVAEFGMQAGIPVILIENAPRLYSASGYPFFVRFVPIAEKFGYTIQLYKTSTALHGLPQNRIRSFVILWKGKSQPLLNWIREPFVPLTQWPVEHGNKQYVQKGRGSDDELVNALYKRFGGRDQLYSIITSPRTGFRLAQEVGLGYHEFKTAKYRKLFNRAKYKAVLDVTPTFVRDYTGALMWRITTFMLSPQEDRFISVRELMSMMGLPKDYEELPLKSMNAIFQNVPTVTTQTLVKEIQAALDNKRPFKKVPFMRVNNIDKTIDSIGYTFNSLKLY